ncbi:MAG: choice-of-anchor L domain-containing protein [Saprospiraceae bacterium]|nr:choice-of-anchor L domain-containing protein [Saprospiraceae bacterium]
MRFYFILLLSFYSVQAAFGQAEVRTENLIPYVSPYARGGSNLLLDTAYSVQELISDFFSNSCVEPFNITMKGNSAGMGFFQAVGTELGVPAGILLSSGNISNTKGPNNSGSAGNSLGKPGDEDLNLLSGQTTFDALAIHFDFIPSVEKLTFRYVFASEEYPEYVCASFNDIFSFFVSGPGLDGSFSENAINIATLPNKSIYVGINSVNPGVPGAFGNPANCAKNGSLDFGAYYVDNTGGQQLQCDGFTMPLDAVVEVVPGEVYHAKIVVADAGDGIFDSNVFLSVESLCGDSLLNPIAEISKLEYTGPKSIAMDGRLKYGYNDWTWDFGDNQLKIKNETSVTHTYSKPGLYTVKMYGSNYCCTDTFSMVVPIQQPPYLAKSVVKPVQCHGMANGQIRLEVLSSIGGLSYLWSDGSVLKDREDLPACEYVVVITDGDGQSSEVGPFIILEPQQLEAEILQGAPGEDGERQIHLVASGGTGPYVYTWADGSNGSSRNDLMKGLDYSVTITDKRGCPQDISFVYGGGEVKQPVQQFQIFPNPANSLLRVSLQQNGECEPGQLNVYNSIGHLIFQSVLRCGVDLDLAVDQWDDGIYILQMITSSGPETRTILVRH